MPEKRWVQKRFVLIAAAVLIGSVIVFFAIVSFFLEPLLKKRLHSLIIDGSDSLYQYSLGSLKADVFGANVAVLNLKMWVDSNRYRQMRQENTLPAITLNLDIKKGQVKGISLLSLLGSKIRIREINTAKGTLTMARYYTRRGAQKPAHKPFWKGIRPTMEGLSIGQIKLDNMQFAYWDLGTEDLQLQFARCDAILRDIKIDSAMLADTTRLGYLRSMSFRLQNLSYLSADSVYKLDVGSIQYTSTDRQLEVDRFYLRPGSSYNNLLRLDTVGKTYFTLQTDKIRFRNIRLERLINANAIHADSLVVEHPKVEVYFDRSAPKDMRSKVGNYPHQLLARAPMDLTVKSLALPGTQVTYTEKSDRTEKEGVVDLRDLNIEAENVTNELEAIEANPVCTIRGDGLILGSPFTTRFMLYLDSANGRFDVEGTVKNITASQLNPLAESLASVRIRTFNVEEVHFAIQANDSFGRGRIRIRYNGIEVEVLKTDPQTGDVETRRFLTSLVNKYMTHPFNPDPDGTERIAENATIDRLLWHSFFGLIWKTIFLGMQNIILKT